MSKEGALYQARVETGAGDMSGQENGGDWRTVTLSHAQVIEADRPRVLQRASNVREKIHNWRFEATERLEALDLAPDLAEQIGTVRWFRGLVTLLGLSAAALSFWPSFAPLEAAPAVQLDQQAREEFRSQAIMPLALGSDSGSRMGAAQSVTDLPSAPERPQIQMVATLAQGDSFGRMLRRAGVGAGDADRVVDLVSRSIALGDIQSGTQLDITLGRRPEPGATRPLEALDFRAKFDLALAIQRGDDGNLSLQRKPIRVDDTPLRIRGTVGSSLYRSARAAGAPASAVQQYLKVLGDHTDLDRSARSSDTFDMIVSYRRAATGERQAGKLLFAGIERDGKAKTQLMRWGSDGKFFEASGVGEQRSGLVAPVNGKVGSRYGMRRHPILGYRRMHSGLDYRAGYGTPIRAVTDGRVSGAGRMGGCGIAVRLKHAGSLETRYCHMSKMAVRRGQSVRRGQVIGYVGSTGLSTGPHLHYEMYRNGRSINPASVRYVTRAQLSGDELRRFRSSLSQLKTLETGSALEDLAPRVEEQEQPQREIDKLAATYARKVEG
nr:M23 family metallopeptidase [Parerythrobacter jejuensis]